MRHLPYFTLCAALAAASCAARAAGTIADVTIVDRDSGAALHTYYYHGEYWVAGRSGARYAIRIRNRLGERLLAVTSVDGVNVLSGESAAWDQAGYVFNPDESYQITGWRKTDAEVAAFTFTDSPNSYAQRTGRPANVGVVGVAVFRERQPQPVYTSPPIGQSPAPAPPLYESTPLSGDSVARAQTAPSVAPPAPSVAPPVPSPKLGTGHGEREYSSVMRTEFLRMQPQPNEIIRIRYDSLDNLLAMGIITRPRAAPPTPNPFPVSPEPQYVPDPPG